MLTSLFDTNLQDEKIPAQCPDAATATRLHRLGTQCPPPHLAVLPVPLPCWLSASQVFRMENELLFTAKGCQCEKQTPYPTAEGAEGGGYHLWGGGEEKEVAHPREGVMSMSTAPRWCHSSVNTIGEGRGGIVR